MAIKINKYELPDINEPIKEIKKVVFYSKRIKKDISQYKTQKLLNLYLLL